MQNAQVLQTRSSGYGRRLLASFAFALATTALIFTCLYLIVNTYQAMVAQEAPETEVITQFEQPVPKKKKTPAQLGPERLITVPGGPTSVRIPKSAEALPVPDLVEAPPVTETTELLVLEELDEELPFQIEKPTPPKSKTKPKRDTRVATVANRGPSQAELARRERARQAKLAKKIKKSAVLVSSKPPKYPRSAERKRLQGRVTIAISIGASGKVASCRVLRSSGHASLDQAALSAVRRYRFKPAINGLGQPIATTLSRSFDFKPRS